jgi:hypothetical protein
MTDTPYKGRDMPRRIKTGSGATARQLCWPAPLFGSPFKAGLQGADYNPCGRGVVLCQHTGGSGGFLVHNDPPDHPQNYPEAGVWRTVQTTTVTLAPGSGLELRVIAMRSGMSQYEDANPLWQPYGVNGRLRVTIEYVNLDSNTTTAVAEVALAPSPEEDGAQPEASGSAWGHLLFKHVPLVAPAEVKAGDLAEIAKWSEDTTITVTVEHQGGARVIQCLVQKVPYKYAAADDDEANMSIHVWPDDAPPPARPQTEVADGPTNEEHRFGVAHGLRVAARQSQQLGPVLATWTSYTEGDAEVTDTEPDPLQTASSTYVGLSIGSSITSWSVSGPGYAVYGCYALRNPENLRTRLNRSQAGVVPVRAWGEVRFTAGGANAGYLKFQSTARSWVEIPISQAVVGTTWRKVTITFFIESMVAPNDVRVNLQDFFKTTGGATLQVRGWSLVWGDKAVA